MLESVWKLDRLSRQESGFYRDSAMETSAHRETGGGEGDKRLAEFCRQWRLFESGTKKLGEILGKSGIEESLRLLLLRST